MNVWRWLGASLFVVVLGMGVAVHGQDKKTDDKKTDKKTDDKKADDKKAGEKKGDDKKTDDKKTDDKKTDDKKGETKPAAGSVELKWKAFESTTPFFQEMTTSTVQTMKVANMEVKQTQSQTFVVEWTPQKKEGEEYVVKQKIVAVKMDIEIGGNKISFDSKSKEQPANPLTDFFKNLVGAEFTLKIDSKTLKVNKIEGQDKFIADLSKANPALQGLLKAILSENALKQMADPLFAAIPEKAVAPKASWPKKSTLDMGPIGTYTTDSTYTLDGTKEKDKEQIADISVTTSLKYTAPKDAKSTDGLPFRIVSGNLEGKKGTGTVVFNLTKGRVEESNMTLELAGDLTIEIAGMTTDVNLRQTQTSKLKTLDKAP